MKKIKLWITVLKEDVQAEVVKLEKTPEGTYIVSQVEAIVAQVKASALADLKANEPAIFSAAGRLLAELILDVETLL